MKAVIMAGGLGKRIASLNSSLPKPLIPIDNKPILQWEIECLVRQGLTDIILTVSHMAEKIQEYFQDGGLAMPEHCLNYIKQGSYLVTFSY